MATQSKHERKQTKACDRAARAAVSFTDAIDRIPGVLSVHMQYGEPLAVVVVLVDSDAAKRAVRGVEERLFDESPDLPVDLHVQRVGKDEVASEQAALATAFGLLWARV